MTITLATPGAQSFQIPLQNVPQTFQITLGGVVYTMSNVWNDIGQFWALNIADSNGNAIVSNIPMITGADLLDGLEYLGINGSLYVITDGSDPDDVPTLQTLGVSSNLYFITTVTNG